MTCEVRDVVCDYGVYENGELKLILNSRRIAEKIVQLLKEDERKNRKSNSMSELGRLIPKKPIPNSPDMFGIKCCICPVCSCHVYSTSNSFCHRCGQALDWSDKE